MRASLFGGAVLLALASAAALAAPARRPVAHHAATARDWSRTVTLSDAGSYVLGNPKARVKLLEYGSYTCPHCAHFSGTVLPQVVAKYVRSGQVSYEFRNAVRDRYDLVASVLSRCIGTTGFFPSSAAVFAAQEDWMDQAIAYEQAHADEINALPVAAKGTAIAKAAGLDSLFAARGLSLDRQHACLADDAMTSKVVGFTHEAEDKNIPGTPALFINGVLLPGLADWPKLDAAIGAALTSQER